MDANGPVDLAAAPKQVAEREVGLDGFALDLEHLQEHLDGLVGLFVEQIVEAPDVARPELGRRSWSGAACQIPARGGGDR